MRPIGDFTAEGTLECIALAISTIMLIIVAIAAARRQCDMASSRIVFRLLVSTWISIAIFITIAFVIVLPPHHNIDFDENVPLTLIVSGYVSSTLLLGLFSVRLRGVIRANGSVLDNIALAAPISIGFFGIVLLFMRIGSTFSTDNTVSYAEQTANDMIREAIYVLSESTFSLLSMILFVYKLVEKPLLASNTRYQSMNNTDNDINTSSTGLSTVTKPTPQPQWKVVEDVDAYLSKCDIDTVSSASMKPVKISKLMDEGGDDDPYDDDMIILWQSIRAIFAVVSWRMLVCIVIVGFVNLLQVAVAITFLGGAGNLFGVATDCLRIIAYATELALLATIHFTRDHRPVRVKKHAMPSTQYSATGMNENRPVMSYNPRARGPTTEPAGFVSYNQNIRGRFE